MNLFDFIEDASPKNSELNPLGSYLSKGSDRFVEGKWPIATSKVRKKNIPTRPIPAVTDEEEEETPSFNMRDFRESQFVWGGASQYGEEGGEEEVPAFSMREYRESYLPPVETHTSATPTVEAKKEPLSFAQAMGKSASQLGKGVIAPFTEIPRIASNLASVPIDIVWGRYFGEEVPWALGLAEKLRAKWAEATSSVQESAGFSPFQQKASGVVTDIASTVALPGGAVGSAKALQGINVGGKVTSGIARTWVLGARGVADAAKFSTASRGDVTPTAEEAVMGAGIGVAWNLAKSIPWIRKLAGKSEILNAWDDIVVHEGKIIGSRPEIVKKIEDAAIKLGNIKTAGRPLDEVNRQTNKVIRWAMGLDEKAFKSPTEVLDALSSREKELLALKKLSNQKFSTRLWKKAFNEKITVGSTTKQFNPVDDAFDALDDKASLSKLSNEDAVLISDLKKRYENVGLNKDELDTLAGFYGRVNDAYKKGNLQTSKVLSENVRNALKDKVRTGWGEDITSSTLDKTYSDVRTAREWLSEILGEVRGIEARTSEKFWDAIGREAANMTQSSTLSILRGFLRSMFGSGEVNVAQMGKKELAEEVVKNLKIIQKYGKMVDEAKTAEEARRIINSAKAEFTKNGILSTPEDIKGFVIPKKNIPKTKTIPKPKK